MKRGVAQAQVCIGSKSSLPTPQSGQVQVSGIAAQRVPGAIPSSGRPSASLYMKPQTTHIQVR